MIKHDKSLYEEVYNPNGDWVYLPGDIEEPGISELMSDDEVNYLRKFGEESNF